LVFLLLHRGVGHITDQAKLKDVVLRLGGYAADGKRQTRQAKRRATNEFHVGGHSVPLGSADAGRNSEEYCFTSTPTQCPRCRLGVIFD
jgi:hypothetical protein